MFKNGACAVSQLTAIRENGASSGIGVLAQFTYDNFGRRTGLTRGNGQTTSYAYDAASRLEKTGHKKRGHVPIFALEI